MSEMLGSTTLKSGDHLKLTGWLVDTNDGLYILGDHYPEDYAYALRVKVENGDIMYPILEKVPSLGGGWSLLFHRVSVDCVVVSCAPWLIKSEKLSIEVDRGTGRFVDVDIDPDIVAGLVDRYGCYKFDRPRDPLRDWLDD
ncbi:hypothetical protein ABEG10_13450 [Burkholderia cenocepacia]|uniref:hypothetical protein n=2 Tax=Burkholderia cenocepacia TaxID=95486 RepID=UPI0020A0E2E1|nr:hypothetical protein [Burkholderia cenocepacia]MCO8502481.1 hypothetical protein [Burkholderia cenocepacia]MCO8539121.1 hypothetical protein [Burkholderia cenocepacia]